MAQQAPMPFRRAAVIGAGAWGTALANVCRRAGLEVVLWAREAEVVRSIAFEQLRGKPRSVRKSDNDRAGRVIKQMRAGQH